MFVSRIYGLVPWVNQYLAFSFKVNFNFLFLRRIQYPGYQSKKIIM